MLTDNAGDKDISVGEISSLTGENVRMVNSQICFISKDLSEIAVSIVNLESSIVGFAAFQKKPEYEPANISTNNLKINQIPIPYLIEKNSKMKFDNQTIPATEKKLQDILYTGKYYEKTN